MAQGPRTGVPAYRLHKASGQAVVTLDGRDLYLGRHGTPESRAEYDRVVSEWLNVGRAQASGGEHEPSVSEVLLAYWRFAKGYYRKNGQATTEQDCIKHALVHVRRHYAETLAKKFGPLALANVRASMVAAGWARTTVNHQVGRVKRAFKWATAQELIPSSVYHGLLAVSGLQRGRTEAPEPAPVLPVPQAQIDAILPHVAPQVAAMIQLQRLTGMRPGEVILMRVCDLNTSDDVWVYTPMSHKTEHRGRPRTILFGPKAQEIVRPFLGQNLSGFIFSPRDAMAIRRVERRRQRRSPMTPSQRARKVKAKPKRAPRDRYEVDSYRRAIDRGCEKAVITKWSPNQLRHSAATEIRKKFGLDAARAVLGHATVTTTEIYAAEDTEAARNVMRSVG